MEYTTVTQSKKVAWQYFGMGNLGPENMGLVADMQTLWCICKRPDEATLDRSQHQARSKKKENRSEAVPL